MNRLSSHKSFFYLILIFFMALLIEGVSRLNYILTDNIKFIKFASFSSYLNLIITSFFSVFLQILIYTIIRNVMFIFDIKSNIKLVLKSLNFSIINYIIFLIFKIILNIVMLDDLNLNQIAVENIFEYVVNTDWYIFSQYLYYTMYILGFFIFFISFSNNNSKHKDIFIITVTYFLCLLIYIFVKEN